MISQRSAPYSDFHIQGNCATRCPSPRGAEITHQLIAYEVSDTMEISRRGARVPSRHPVGEQRASKVKFLKPFSSGPPPRSSSTSRVSADGSGGHRWKHRVPAARSFSRGVLASLSGKERVPLPRGALKPGRGRPPSPARWGARLRGRVVTQICAPHLGESAGAQEGVPRVLGGTVRISKVKPAGAAPTGKSARPLPPAPGTCPHQLATQRLLGAGDPSFGDSALP